MKAEARKRQKPKTTAIALRGVTEEKWEAFRNLCEQEGRLMYRAMDDMLDVFQDYKAGRLVRVEDAAALAGGQ